MTEQVSHLHCNVSVDYEEVIKEHHPHYRPLASQLGGLLSNSDNRDFGLNDVLIGLDKPSPSALGRKFLPPSTSETYYDSVGLNLDEVVRRKMLGKRVRREASSGETELSELIKAGCSTLIGPGLSRLCSHWLRSWCSFCHKDSERQEAF